MNEKLQLSKVVLLVNEFAGLPNRKLVGQSFKIKQTIKEITPILPNLVFTSSVSDCAGLQGAFQVQFTFDRTVSSSNNVVNEVLLRLSGYVDAS